MRTSVLSLLNSRVTRITPSLTIAVIGIAVIVYQWLRARPLWLDEEMIALNIRSRTLSELHGQLWLDQGAPWGWLAAQRILLTVFGDGEIVLRALPALFGIATLLAAVWVGFRWLSPVGAAVFVLLCAFGQWVSFHATELKHYSADVLFAVWLPGLTVWALESDVHTVRRRRVMVWAAVAATAHWFSFGALFVIPACLTVLGLHVVFRRDRTFVPLLSAAVCVWTLSFGVHYELSIGDARDNETLQSYWSFAFPPEGAGIGGSVAWLGRQLEPFAAKPGGTTLWLTLWLAAAIGMLTVQPRTVGLVSAAVVCSGALLAVFRAVPLYERLSLWLVPSIYLGAACCVDALPALWRRPRRHYWLPLSALALSVALIGSLCADVYRRGTADLEIGRPADSNHSTNDRAAIAWMMQQRQPGDAILTTRHALPAVWWYSGGGVNDTTRAGGLLADGTPLFEVEHQAGADRCDRQGIAERLSVHRRLLLYFGFPDTSPAFDDFVLVELATFAAVTEIRHFSGLSRVAILEIGAPTRIDPHWDDAGRDATEPVRGCMVVREAKRW